MPSLRNNFTLIELVAVIAIMTLVLGMSVSMLRKNSDPAKFENSILSFKEFCMASRAQAAELGRDRVIYYIPEERIFRSGDPRQPEIDLDAIVVLETSLQEPEPEDPENPAGLKELKWLLPKEFVMDADEEALGEVDEDAFIDDGRIEVFRFFPDGSASGVRDFRIQYRDLSRTLTISPLTGRMTVKEETP